MSFVEWLWTIGSIGSLIALVVVLVDTEIVYYRMRARREDFVWIRVPATAAERDDPTGERATPMPY